MENKQGSKPKNLTQYALMGFFWNLAGNFTRTFAGFLIGVVLARLLGPEPFGVVALALVIINIGNLIVESGLSSGLIQKSTIDDQDISFVFTLQIIFGGMSSAFLMLVSPLLVVIFKVPEAVSVFQVLAAVLVIQAFSQVSIALLKRAFSFKKIQQAQLISYLLGYLCIGIPLALNGLGVWSLVVAQLVQSLLNSLMLFLFVRHSLTLSIKGSKDLRLFGIRTLGTNIANWIIQNVDNLIIGQAFGPTSLGLYSRSYNLSLTPANTFLISAQSVLLAASSRVEQKQDINKIFTSVFSVFCAVFWPTYSLLALGSFDFVHLIYGEKWDLAAPLLTPLALAMPFLILMGLQGPLLSGLGKPEYELRVSWQTAVTAIIVLIIASRISLIVAAWSILLIYGLRFLLMSRATVSVLEMPWIQLIKPLFAGLALAGLLCALWIILGILLAFINASWLQIFIKMIVLAGTWLLIMICANRLLGLNIISTYKSIMNNRYEHN